jgi:uncharacterized membrane protein
VCRRFIVCLGFLVDKGVPLESFLATYICSVVALAATLFLAGYLNTIIHWIYSFARKILHPHIISSFSSQDYNNNKPTLRVDKTIVLVNFLFVAGFLGPALLAAYMPDYRATLMQTGFLLNGIASIVTALTVERRIARTCHAGELRGIRQLELDMSVSKALGALLSAGLFLFLYAVYTLMISQRYVILLAWFFLSIFEVLFSNSSLDAVASGFGVVY